MKRFKATPRDLCENSSITNTNLTYVCSVCYLHCGIVSLGHNEYSQKSRWYCNVFRWGDQAGVFNDHSDDLAGVGVQGSQSHLPIKWLFREQSTDSLNLTSSSSEMQGPSSFLLSSMLSSSDPLKTSPVDLDWLLWSWRLEGWGWWVDWAGRLEEVQQ